PADIPLGYGQQGRPPVLVMVSGYSRMITARMLPTRMTGDLIDGHWQLLSQWGAVPRMLVWDNEAGIGQGKVTAEFSAFAGMLATRVFLCRPRDPEAKGLVEPRPGAACESLPSPPLGSPFPPDLPSRSGWYGCHEVSQF
ncbi:DDE-type integrase/transposase/recombinase, partial [Streptomyces sp. NPDC057910]|uniref:DDE-type integrase/transposase/recombinase n=1 Tax=Streptomyces sp. NPDC057910 TaxID=3346278 RepID=UPI0036E68785